jgi:hypothetical protein
MAIVLRDRSNKPEEFVIHYAPRKIVVDQQDLDKQLAEVGNRLWAELHSNVTLETLPIWETRIPNFGCACRKFYREWKAQHPPPTKDFFAWTVELHNAVNDKLGKPQITLNEAIQIWMV